MSKYDDFDLVGLKDRGAMFSEYQKIVNQDPFEWTLQDVEVVDDKTKLVKTVKAMKLAAVYFLLDAIYHTYDTEIHEIRLIGKAIIVTVRLTTVDKDGVRRCRDGSGFVEATEGVRNATSMAEANAIKNAAKKLGKVFGRDLYADDEPKKLPPKTNLPSDSVENREEPAIQVNEEEINPVYTSIVNQLKKAQDPEDLRAISNGMVEEADNGNLDGQEFEHLTELINKKISEIKKAKNGTRVKQSGSGGKVSRSLHGGTNNKTTGSNGGGSVRGNPKQNSAKKPTTRKRS